MSRARAVLIGAGIGFLAALLAGVAGWLPFTRTVEMKTYDQRLRWTANPASAGRDIALVLIDEDSIRRMEPLVGRWPWPRLVHADLIDYLARAPAKVVAYDVLFTERDRRSGFKVGEADWTGDESDAALADSTRRAGNIVHLADATFGGTDAAEGINLSGERPQDEAPPDQPAAPASAFHLQGDVEQRPAVTLPYDALARASRVIAHNFFVLDEDGPARRTVPFVRIGEQFFPSLPVAAAVVAQRVSPSGVRIEGGSLELAGKHQALIVADVPAFETGAGAGRSLRALINFRGPAILADGASTLYPSYSFYRLFYSQQQILAGETPVVDPAVFRDKAVFVGVTAAGLHDVFTGPFGATGKIAGAQLHANTYDDLVSGRFMRPAPLAWDAIAVAAPAVVVGIASAAAPVSAGAAAAMIVALTTAGAAIWLFAQGFWIVLAQPIVAIALSVFGGVSYQYFVEGREKRRVKKLFSRYVSPDVYEQLLANPGLAVLGGQRRHMTVLFCDIRAFTTLTEQGSPEDIVAQLNEYFSTTVKVIFANRGTVDKFVGDMVMALFGAPLDDPDHADHAAAAALDMREALARLNEQWAAEGRPRLEIGIGINTGEMIAGNIGSDRIMSYTVIGDAVNLGARLEVLTKEYKAPIIISEATRAALKISYHVRALGGVVVKGKSQAVSIYELTSRF